MKIRHAELEACRKSPAAWLASTGGIAGRFGYDRAVKLAISHFHETGSHGAAQDKLEGYLAKNFADKQRKQVARDSLDNYVVAFEASEWLVADTQSKLSLALGQDIFMSGEMSRIDVHPKTDDYQAILLSPAIGERWETELRWPLIQLAVSQKYSRAVDEVSVGIQMLDGSSIETRSFSKARIGKSVAEAAALAERINALKTSSK